MVYYICNYPEKLILGWAHTSVFSSTVAKYSLKWISGDRMPGFMSQLFYLLYDDGI